MGALKVFQDLYSMERAKTLVMFESKKKKAAMIIFAAIIFAFLIIFEGLYWSRLDSVNV